MRQAALQALCGAIAMAVATASPAAGQTTDREWEIEAHIGGSFFSNPTSGQAQLPPVGAGYLVDPSWPPSRQVSSWYFGDGVVLFNSARLPFQTTVPITALDPVLTRGGIDRTPGLSLGFRVSRAINDRVSAEFSVDGNLAHARMADATRAGIEATSSSFERAFDSMSSFDAVSSSATIRRTGGRYFGASGALNVNLLTRRRLTPYATIGGGILWNQGAMPGAALVGKYQVPDPFGETSIILVNDTDTVTVRFEEKTSPMFLLGGGLKFDLTSRTGIRGDVRFSIARSRDRIVIDALPSHAGVPDYSLTFIGRGASMVFSLPGNPRPPSLSGPELTDFGTFAGSGYQVQTAVTFGSFVRF